MLYTTGMEGKLSSTRTARLIRALARNEWSDEARAAALETRRRKAKSSYQRQGYRFYGKRAANKYQPRWINQWEKKNAPKPDESLKRWNKRLEMQYRDFGHPIVEAIESFGRKVGYTQLLEKISGSKGDHASWVDKKTGYRYDFHPAVPGKGIIGESDGKLVETAPDGSKRELRGPKYQFFKRNCQMANKFLPRYIKKFNKLREAERELGSLAVANMLMIINGGPGSGFHGHKGIKGHRGGSMPEDGSAPSTGLAVRSPIMRAYGPPALSETPQASSKRRKLAFTRASKLADVFGSRADDLESKRKAMFRLKDYELEELADTHQQASDNYKASAEQSTLMKGATIQEQKQRLAKAAYHRAMARKYNDKLGRKGGGSEFTRRLGSAFVYGLIGGTPEEVAQRIAYKSARAGADIGTSALKGGFRQAVKEGTREIEEEQDLTMPKSEVSAAESLVRRAGGNPFTPRERAEYRKEQKQTAKRAPTYREAAERIGLRAKIAAKVETRKQLQGVKDQNLESKIDAEIARRRETAKEEYKKSREEAQKFGIRASDVRPAKTSTESRQVGDITIGPNREPVVPSSKDIEDKLVAEAKKQAERNRLKTQSLENALTFNSIVVNLSGQVRRATLHGKDYLVAPLSMIVPGVLPGSKGALFYPEEEVQKNPSAWNNIPIVVNHPMKDGIPVEARSPDILERYQIGTVFNAKYNGKLVAEGWFDINRTRKVNTGVYDMLLNGRPIELSTGLYTDNEPFEGTWNGRDYKYIARNYRPDHLAILLTSKGACSLKDGCGVLINREQPTDNIVHKIKGGFKLVSHKGKSLGTAKTKAGIMKRERQVEYFKHVKNEHICNEIRAMVHNGMLGSIGRGVRKVADKMRGIVPAQAVGPITAKIVKKPGFAKKTGAAVGGAVGAGASAVGRKAWKHKKKLAIGGAIVGAHKLGQLSREDQVQNIGYFASKILGKPKKGESKLMSRTRAAHHGASGFGSALAGGVAGGLAGAAVGGPAAPVTGLIGAAVGSATGGWAAHRQAKKMGGAKAAKAADWGGLAGSLATPGGVSKGIGKMVGRKAATAVGVRAVSTGSKVSKIAKGAGKMAIDTGAYEGTTAALDKTFGVKKHKPRAVRLMPTSNAWTEEARRKSAETRRYGKYRKPTTKRRQEYSEPKSHTGAILAGATISGAGAGLGVSARKNLVEAGKATAGAVKRSFAEPADAGLLGIKRAPGYGRRLINLLKRIKLRRI